MFYSKTKINWGDTECESLSQPQIPNPFPYLAPYKLSCSDSSRLEAASALLHACFIIFIQIRDRARELANIVAVDSDRNLVVVWRYFGGKKRLNNLVPRTREMSWSNSTGAIVTHGGVRSDVRRWYCRYFLASRGEWKGWIGWKLIVWETPGWNFYLDDFTLA